MRISKTGMGLLVGAFVFSGTGCEGLQRNQLNKLNRETNSMPSSDYNFSIPDPPLPSAESQVPAQPASAKCSSNICPE